MTTACSNKDNSVCVSAFIPQAAMCLLAELMLPLVNQFEYMHQEKSKPSIMVTTQQHHATQINEYNGRDRQWMDTRPMFYHFPLDTESIIKEH